MRLYEKYGIEDADFINVELTTDNEKWIDPMKMHMDKSPMGLKCCSIIQQYFQKLLKFAMDGKYKEGYEYIKNFSELNETRLGYSQKRPKGLSGGEQLGNEIFNLIKHSEAIKTGLVGDIFDAGVMIEKFGIDKMSDFITNLILEELILYTQRECENHNIPMKNIKFKGKYWLHSKQVWMRNTMVNLPFDDDSNMAIIFVPKSFCETKLIYSPERFYTKAMIPFLGKEAVNNRISGLIRILKNNTIKPYYKEIKKQNPCTRKNVNKFINRHSDVYKEYKRKQLSYIDYDNYKD